MQRSPASAQPTRRDWWWIFDPRQSLRARVSVGIILVGVALTLLSSWLATSMLRRTLEQQLGTAFETLAVQVSDKIDRAIFERYRALQFTGNLAALRNADSLPDEKRRVLDALRQTTPDFGWVGFIDARGEVIAATSSLYGNANVGDRPWFRAARERPYAGGMHELPTLARGSSNDEPEPSSQFFDLAVPVAGSDGRFAGVLAAHVRWSWAREVQLSVIAESALQQKIGVTIYAGPSEVILDSGNSGWTQPPDAPLVPDARRFRGFMVEPASVGTTYLSGYARSRGHREYKGLGWFTVVRQPLQRALQPVATLRRATIGWGLVFTAVAAAAGWWSATSLSRSLRRIGASAERIREGDILSVLPSPQDGSEVSRMCHSVGNLVAELRAKNEALAKENARLAAERREVAK